ncbi:MAG TPA: TetR/AcrR family transcriptional regulator [Roseomonas sp.]|jgi:AcrR family transcriptional regulator
MGRIAGSDGARTAAAIRRAGLRLIHKRGYGAMGLRELAAEVGIQPASLYNHIGSKQELLFELIHEHMVSLLASARAALGAAAPQAPERLRAFVVHHVVYHLGKKAEVFVANFELRSLEPQAYERIVALRRAYEEMLIGVLEQGTAERCFRIPDSRIAAYAILAMLTGSCTWYRPGGRLSRSQVAAIHAGMVLRSCGWFADEGAEVAAGAGAR